MKPMLAVLATLWVTLAAALTLGSCGDDPDSRDDLPEERVDVDMEGANVVAFPDRYPNVAWRCAGHNGLYTTTNRVLLIVVNDRNCTETGEPRVVGDTGQPTTTENND
jgi:hypothetical protein